MNDWSKAFTPACEQEGFMVVYRLPTSSKTCSDGQAVQQRSVYGYMSYPTYEHASGVAKDTCRKMCVGKVGHENFIDASEDSKLAKTARNKSLVLLRSDSGFKIVRMASGYLISETVVELYVDIVPYNNAGTMKKNVDFVFTLTPDAQPEEVNAFKEQRSRTQLSVDMEKAIDTNRSFFPPKINL